MKRKLKNPRDSEGQLSLELVSDQCKKVAAPHSEAQEENKPAKTKKSSRSTSAPTKPLVSPGLLACTHVPLAEAASVTAIPEQTIRRWFTDGFLPESVEIDVVGAHNQRAVFICVAELLRFLMTPAAGAHALRPVTMAITSLVLDTENFQVRVSTRASVVAAYSKNYGPQKKGMGGVAAFNLGECIAVVDGFHRVPAADMAGCETIPVYILPGDFRWARIAARELNDYNPIPLSTKDRRRQLLFFLQDNTAVKDRLLAGEITYRAFEEATGFGKNQVCSTLKKLRGEPAPSAVPLDGAVANAGDETLRLLAIINEETKAFKSARNTAEKREEPLARVVGAVRRLVAIHRGHVGLADPAELIELTRNHEATVSRQDTPQT